LKEVVRIEGFSLEKIKRTGKRAMLSGCLSCFRCPEKPPAAPLTRPKRSVRLQYTKVSENIENWVNFGDIENQ